MKQMRVGNGEAKRANDIINLAFIVNRKDWGLQKHSVYDRMWYHWLEGWYYEVGTSDLKAHYCNGGLYRNIWKEASKLDKDNSILFISLKYRLVHNKST